MRVLIRTPLDCRLAEALRPDDVDLPEGMEVRHLCLGGAWAVEVLYRVRETSDILTLKNTVDDIIRSLAVAASVSR